MSNKINLRDVDYVKDLPSTERIVKKRNQNAETTKSDHGKEIKAGRRKTRRRSNSNHLKHYT